MFCDIIEKDFSYCFIKVAENISSQNEMMVVSLACVLKYEMIVCVLKYVIMVLCVLKYEKMVQKYEMMVVCVLKYVIMVLCVIKYAMMVQNTFPDLYHWHPIYSRRK